MSALRIGYFLETVSRQGGGFQQSLSTINAIANAMPEYELVVLTPHRDNILMLRSAGLRTELYSAGWRGQLDGIQGLSLPLGYALDFVRGLGFRRLGRNLDFRLKELGIDIAIFNVYTTALRLADHPYVVTVWDLCHLDLPEFPGVSLSRQFERREAALRTALPKAVAVVANCASESERIARIYDVEPKRIIVLPFLPSTAVRRHVKGRGTSTLEAVRARYGLPQDYVYYPAQFCADKNHIYLLDALVAAEAKYGLRLHVVFTGSDTGNRVHVEQYVRRSGLTERAHFLGFVEEGEVPAIYEGARALTMPTYGGPTNLPPLEAAAMGCPVVYSDLPEFRRFMGDAALYCDLKDPQSMADQLNALLTDRLLVERLRQAGQRMVAELGEHQYAGALKPIMDDFAYIRRRWGR